MATKTKEEQKPAPSPLSRKQEWVERLVAGDNRGMRAEAERALADPAAAEDVKEAAREVLARTGIDLRTLAAGLAIAAVQLFALGLVMLR